jgi:hypothetical protein
MIFCGMKNQLLHHPIIVRLLSVCIPNFPSHFRELPQEFAEVT